MKEDLLLQVSMFGSFSTIDTSSESMMKLLQILGKQQLVPMTLRELNMNTQQYVLRPQFTTQNGSISINFGTTRIDIIANNIQGFGILPVDEFKDIVIEWLNELIDSFSIESNRLSFISKSMIPIKNVNQECYKRNNLPIEFYNNKDNFEWSIRNVARVKIALRDINETINVGTTVSRMNVTKNSNGRLENIDSILIDTDINTVAENLNLRFSKHEVSEYLEQVIPMRNDIVSQTEGVYNE